MGGRDILHVRREYVSGAHTASDGKGHMEEIRGGRGTYLHTSGKAEDDLIFIPLDSKKST